MLGDEMVKIAFNSAASIQWENCSDIEIISLVITLVDNFTYSIVFEHTHSVKMFNMPILGNGNNGCSSILSYMSSLNITNSQFIGIYGCLGAALMITASSNITFTAVRMRAILCGKQNYIVVVVVQSVVPFQPFS